MKHLTFLSFDFGMKRIGTAVGQTLTHTAQPLTTLSARDGIPQWEQIDHLIAEWQPDALVVGIPVNMDGTSHNITNAATRFAKQLRSHYHLIVHHADERLTTKESRSRLYEAGGYKRLKNAAIDSIAAVIILEAWMQENPEEKIDR